MSDAQPEVTAEHGWDAEGHPVPVDDPTCVRIEVHTADGGRTYLER